MIIIILLFYPFISFCYDCRSFSLGEARQINYETSDFVFLGVSMAINNNNCEFLVLEKFKGDVKGKVVVNSSNYFNVKDVFTLWLIYGNKITNSDTIYVDICSISRSIANSHILNVQSLPPLFDARNLFRFAASNSTVEWSVAGFQNGDWLVGTLKEGSQAISLWNVNGYSFDNIIYKAHSHGGSVPSYDFVPSSPDLSNSRALLKINKKAQSYLFMPQNPDVKWLLLK